MYYVILNHDGVIVSRGFSSLLIDPPIEEGQTFGWLDEAPPRGPHRWDVATNEFVPLPPAGEDVGVLRAMAKARLDETYAAQIAGVLQPMGPVRALKAAEAERVLASDGAYSSPLIAPEAASRDIDEVELAGMIRARASDQAARLGALEANRQAAQAAIEAADTAADLQSILEQHRGQS